jgi:phage virion morphogenesis protein
LAALMPATITVQTHGFEQAELRIARMLASKKPMLLAQLAETMRKQTVERFGTKVSPDGAAWAPLKQPGKNRGSGDILVDTGTLRGSIASFVTGDAAGAGTGVQYGGFHQHGTRKMVARPFLGFSDENVDEITRVVRRFLDIA